MKKTGFDLGTHRFMGHLLRSIHAAATKVSVDIGNNYPAKTKAMAKLDRAIGLIGEVRSILDADLVSKTTFSEWQDGWKHCYFGTTCLICDSAIDEREEDDSETTG